MNDSILFKSGSSPSGATKARKTVSKNLSSLIKNEDFFLKEEIWDN